MSAGHTSHARAKRGGDRAQHKTAAQELLAGETRPSKVPEKNVASPCNRTRDNRDPSLPPCTTRWCRPAAWPVRDAMANAIGQRARRMQRLCVETAITPWCVCTEARVVCRQPQLRIAFSVLVQATVKSIPTSRHSQLVAVGGSRVWRGPLSTWTWNEFCGDDQTNSERRP